MGFFDRTTNTEDMDNKAVFLLNKHFPLDKNFPNFDACTYLQNDNTAINVLAAKYDEIYNLGPKLSSFKEAFFQLIMKDLTKKTKNSKDEISRGKPSVYSEAAMKKGVSLRQFKRWHTTPEPQNQSNKYSK